MLRKLWADEAGFVISAELVLVATILVIGLIVGMVSVRNQVVEEMVDVGQAIGNLSQSYAFGGIYKGGMAFTDGGSYKDVVDFCQQRSPQAPFGTPGGIVICTGLTNVGPTNGEAGVMLNK
jgi:hypothetical protein